MSTTDAAGPPRLLVFDVNETLSDLTPVAARFAELGLPEHLAAPWFAGVLRDGMALTITGDNPAFADLARASFHAVVHGRADAPADVDAAAGKVIEAFMGLPLHPDVAPGLRALAAAGLRLVTLSNGSAAVAEGLVERAGLDGVFERILSVSDAPRWKPRRLRLPVRTGRVRGRTAATRCSWPSTRGTPTAQSVPGCVRRTSPGRAPPTRGRCARPS